MKTEKKRLNTASFSDHPLHGPEQSRQIPAVVEAVFEAGKRARPC